MLFLDIRRNKSNFGVNKPFLSNLEVEFLGTYDGRERKQITLTPTIIGIPDFYENTSWMRNSISRINTN